MSDMIAGQPVPVGDAAVAVRIEGGSAGETLRRVRAVGDAILAAAIPGVADVVSSPGRVTVAYDPLAIDDVAAFAAAVSAAASRAGVDLAAAAGPAMHAIPVCYDGPDLEAVCASHGIDRRRFIAHHTEPDYLVEAIGFLPGFGYLAGLPGCLATPRRPTPRRQVPAGAVGIGGGQTGVYPFASPGGWNLVGRSPARLFDPRAARPARLAAGDRVRFVAADLPPAEPAPLPRAAAARGTITVVEPGLFTTIQDLGRPGHRASGVPLSGAADPFSLRLANLLVGNPEGAAGIECTLLGPRLRFDRETVVALVGATFPGLPAATAIRVTAGAELALGHATTGCRGCLAVAGGIDVEPVLGSRSTLVAAALGGLAGRPRAAGDRVPVGAGGSAESALRRTCGATAWGGPLTGGRRTLRILPGEHAERLGGREWSSTFRVSSRSDRMGVRLEGAAWPGAAAGGGMASMAVWPGAVQLPPDGCPILLLADAQTIGGYPVVGHVITADLPAAAQLRPGEEVRWEPVTLDEARAALREQEAVVTAFREAIR